MAAIGNETSQGRTSAVLNDQTGIPDTELGDRRKNLRNALRVGIFAWPAFGLMDMWVATVVDPTVSLQSLLLWRFVGTVVLLLCWWTASDRMGLRRTTAYELITFQTTSLLISIMSVEYGGLNSPYIHGVTVVVVVHAFTMTSRWTRALPMVSLTALSFPAVMLVAAAFRPLVAKQWAELRSVAEFVQDFLFVYSVVIVGSIISHQLWAARRQVYEARKIGRYRLRKRIGHGGMGQVWEARDEHEKRDVALKLLLLDKDIGSNAAYRARFEREARAMSQLASPNTVRLYDAGSSDDGVWFIAMELLRGEDLASYIKRGGCLDHEHAAKFMLQACDSLTEAHHKGIVHRDVKPSNLFVREMPDGGERIKVLDFGIAKTYEDPEDPDKLTMTGLVIGTPGMPATERADIYGLGAVGYFLLTGESPGWRPRSRTRDSDVRPTTADSTRSAVSNDPPDRTRNERNREPLSQQQVLDERRALPNWVPVGDGFERPDLEAALDSHRVPKPIRGILLRCLEADARDRYDSMEVLADDLRTLPPGEGALGN
jgi:serine/threonine-protein kinase